MINVDDTLLVQYANSDRIKGLIEVFNDHVDPRVDLATFIAYVWDIRTAQAWGLDILGRIVGVSRYLQVAVEQDNWGFNEATDALPFDDGVFYNGPAATSTYALSDEAYRTLILFKALANISDSSYPTLNRLLCALFKGRGPVYVTSYGNMRMGFVFLFPLTPVEQSLVTTSGVLPVPSGVQATATNYDPDNTFGFSEAGDDWQPFDQGTFVAGSAFLSVV